MTATCTTTVPTQVASDLTELARIAGQRVDIEDLGQGLARVTLAGDFVAFLRETQRPEDDWSVDADGVMWAAGYGYQLV